MDYKPVCFKHKFSIDAILGTSQTEFTSVDNKQNLNHTATETSWTQEKIEPQYPQSPTVLSKESKKINHQKDHSYSSHFSLTPHSSADYLRETLSFLRRNKTEKSNNFDSTTLVSPEVTKNRSPRIPFSPVQLQTLEKKFQQTHYLSGWEVNHLAKKLNLSETRVKIWFQNRRARERRDSGISNHPDSTNYQLDYTPPIETNKKIKNADWQIPETNKHLDSAALSNYIDDGPFNLINPMDVYPVKSEATTTSHLLYNPYQLLGYPFRLNFNNWTSYHPEDARSNYPDTGSSNILPKLLYQTDPEQSHFNQSSFGSSNDHNHTLEMNPCNSNLVRYTTADKKESS